MSEPGESRVHAGCLWDSCVTAVASWGKFMAAARG